MPLSYSLLVPPLKSQVQRAWLWPAPAADGAGTPNAPPWQPYVFRAFWQPQLPWLQPPPADIAATNAPLLWPYVFRKGGFWPPQQRWGTQPPADVAQTNAPILRPYAFRPGRLWQFFRAMVGAGADPPIFTAYVPPPTGVPTGEVGGSGRYGATASPLGEATGTTQPGATGVPTGN